MSSLRNAVKRITHKERAQPQARAKVVGFLEKKRDYRVRAKDYHRKQDRLNAMRTKASMRNPDEFYFGMHRSRVRGALGDEYGGGGVDGTVQLHRKTQEARQREFEATVGIDTIRIMKDQDLKYVRMQKQRDVRRVERLESSLHYLDHGGDDGTTKKRKHTVFVGSREEAERFDAADHFDTVPELVGRAFNRPRKEAIRKEALESVQRQQQQSERTPATKAPSDDVKLARRLARARSSAYREVEARRQRIKAMELAEAHLVTEKLVASRGRKRKVVVAASGTDDNGGGGSAAGKMPAQYKWRRKRLG